MRQLFAFIRKEFMELYRTGKLWITMILFVLFGIMNPALAKLTPWIMELSAETLAESGIVLGEVKVDALTSWGQYYKNVSTALIIFVVLFCGILTGEYQKGTLINMLTKGLSRWKVLTAKAVVVLLVWTGCYWMHYGITYAYNAYFWDNSIAENLGMAALCPYVFGVCMIALTMLLSAFFKNNIAVLMGLAAVTAVFYAVEMLTRAGEYMPTHLLASGELLTGAVETSNYFVTILVTMGISVAGMALSVVCFDRRNI